MFREFSRRPVLVLAAALLLCAFAACSDDEASAGLSVFNYPNPCTTASGTKIVVKYTATVAGNLDFNIYIYDQNGDPVLVQRRTNAVVVGANTLEHDWDLTNDKGNKLAPGVYSLKVITVGVAGSVESHKAWNRIMIK